ncbi:rRNA adenine dimethyltransferase family protein [Georgenia sp. 10Sc9-8]|uniref:Ribosomal RNA small subunit methyltransferase A n=1 Tax=Georgenia halotolerans TaxID=3028317 RepID=A0ABT5TZY3_9MICO|nr:rRNA adenine dimethyltransferase family protein [Georgenia halotolerans]
MHPHQDSAPTGDQVAAPGLLGAGDVRRLAASLGVRPTKTLGQNFVHDAGTVRRIVRAAGVEPGETVLEVGPGLGSLTLALLEAGADVLAVEIDPVLAGALPGTVASRLPHRAAHLGVLHADAMTVTGPADLPGVGVTIPAADLPGVGSAAPATDPPDRAAGPPVPTSIVANLPYNVAVPVLLRLLPSLPSVRRVMVMVQAEVADRLAAPPGSRTYGVPSAKAAWYARAERVGTISRTVFWPVPNVDSALVRLTRREPPTTTATRAEVFAVVDAAFSQRRKTLRSALAGWAGSAAAAEAAVRAAGLDPTLRGERLDITEFSRIAERLPAPASGTLSE